MTGLEFVFFLRYRQGHSSRKQLRDFSLELATTPALRVQSFQEVVPYANCGSVDETEGVDSSGAPGSLWATFWGDR